MSENNDSKSDLKEKCSICQDPECIRYAIENKLDYHFNRKKFFRFLASFLIIIISASAGLIAYGFMKEFFIFIGGIILFAIVFFEFWEIKILCSHCPYYGEDNKLLNCNANYGSMKIWKYNPAPMTLSEKIQLMIGFLIISAIILFPSVILIIHHHYLVSSIPAIGLVLFYFVLRKYHCSECPNFSCPFNTVPKDVAEGFIKRHPAMKKAWKL